MTRWRWRRAGMADLVGFVFQDPEAQFVVDTVEDELAFAHGELCPAAGDHA